MHRLFVAIRPPRPVRALLIDQMGGIPGARWQDDGQLHLTLRFIGEVDRHMANDLAGALARIAFKPFEIALAGVGQFHRGAHVDALWAGAQPRDPLARLHAKIDRVCVQAGLRAEERAYLPHVTLARLGRTAGPTDGWLAAHAAFASPPFQVDRFHLFESQLGQSGAVYETVETCTARDLSHKPTSSG